MSPKSGIFTIILAVTVLAGVMCIGAVDAEPAASPTYEIQYEVNEQTYSYTSAVQVVTLQSLESLGLTAPEGKTFTGWQQDGSAVNVAVGSSVTLSSEKATLFIAQFETTTYTVTFISEGETVSTATIDHNGEITKPQDPVREGYVFMGWTPEVAATATADATYTAQWREIFDVVWIVDGTRVASGTTESAETLNVPADPAKEAHQFTGWYDAEGNAYGEKYEFSMDTVFSATFRADTYTVTFVYGEEDTVLGTSTVEHGATVVAPALPSGYIGWDYDFSTTITGDVTIKAIAEPPEEGMSTGMQIALYIVGVVLVVLLLFAGWGLKTGKIVFPKRKG